MGVIPIFEAILNNFTKRGHFSFGLLSIKSGDHLLRQVHLVNIKFGSLILGLSFKILGISVVLD